MTEWQAWICDKVNDSGLLSIARNGDHSIENTVKIHDIVWWLHVKRVFWRFLIESECNPGICNRDHYHHLGISNNRADGLGGHLWPKDLTYMVFERSKNRLKWTAKPTIFTIRRLYTYLVRYPVSLKNERVIFSCSFKALFFHILERLFWGGSPIGKFFFPVIEKKPLDCLPQR